MPVPRPLLGSHPSRCVCLSALICALLVPLLAASQGEAATDLLVHFASPLSEEHEKQLFEQFRDIDPAGTFRYDRSAQQFTIRSSAVDAANAFSQLLAQRTELPACTVVHPDAPRPTERITVDLPGFPPYIDTGDPIKDDQHYTDRKKAWIVQHPEEYERLKTLPNER